MFVVIFTMRRGKNLIGFMFFLGFFVSCFYFFYFFMLKQKYYTIDLSWKKKYWKYIDSHNVIDLSTCYIQLLFRCYYSIGSSLIQGFTFNTVFVALATQQNWSDSTCLLFRLCMHIYVYCKSGIYLHCIQLWMV